MKKVISILTIIIIMFSITGTALADSSDWTLVQIPGSDSGASPVFFDTNTYLASDITTDINDNLYVMSGSRIIRFTPDGRLDKSWGSSGIIYDEDINAMNCEQLDIVADSRGYVYALCRICEDGSPTFIKRYAPDGKADTSWYGDGIMGGKFVREDYETFSEYNLVDDETEIYEGLRNMDEIALGSNDNLYILFDRHVYRYLPDGEPDNSWKIPKMIQPQYEYDEGGGGVWFSNAMRIDHQDNIFLFNGKDRTVSKYDNKGNLLKKTKCGLYYKYTDDFGDTHYLINQVAFDENNNLYHNDYDKNTISKYSPEFKPITRWCDKGILSANTGGYINDYVVDTKGSLYTIDKENAIVSKYTNEGNPDAQWGSKGSLGSVSGDGKATPYINDLLFDNDGSIYVVDKKNYQNPVLIKLNSRFEPDTSWTAKAGDTEEWEFDSYSSVTALGGYVYIEQRSADVRVFESRIIRLNKAGEECAGWEIKISGFVWGMITDNSGYLYIADSNCSISRYNLNGKIDSSWGDKGSIEGVKFLGEMAVDNSGNLYISDRDSQTILKYDPKGKICTGWGEDGKAVIPSYTIDASSSDTFYMTVDESGNLYVSDYDNNMIFRFKDNGLLDTSWCDNGQWRSADDLSSSLVPLISPTHLIINEGKLYAIWNGKLYVMNDSLTNPNDQMPQTTEAPSATEAPVSTEAVTSSVHENILGFWWIVGAGVLAICLITGAVIYIKRKNRS